MKTYKKSYRLSNQCLNKIDELVALENEERMKYADADTSQREIIEKAVEYYHSYKMQGLAGDPFMQKLELMIQDNMKLYLMEMAKTQNAMNFTTQKVFEFVALLVKVNKDLPKEDKEMNNLAKGQSRFEPIIDEKLLSKVNDD